MDIRVVNQADSYTDSTFRIGIREWNSQEHTEFIQSELGIE